MALIRQIMKPNITFVRKINPKILNLNHLLWFDSITRHDMRYHNIGLIMNPATPLENCRVIRYSRKIIELNVNRPLIIDDKAFGTK